MGSARELRERRRAANQCVGCGKPLRTGEIGTFRNCHACRDKNKARNVKKNRRRVIKAKLEGKCVVCKRRLAIPGHTMCGYCSERRETYKETIENFIEGTNLCICGNMKVDLSKKYCEDCRSAGSKRSSKSWAKKQQEKAWKTQPASSSTQPRKKTSQGS